jgi:hypothetical protein
MKQTFYCKSINQSNKQTNEQTQTPVKNATKLISVRCKNLNGSVAELYSILRTADHRIFCWK